MLEVENQEEESIEIESSGLNHETLPKTIVMVYDSTSGGAVPVELENLIEESIYKIYSLNIGVPRVDDPDPEEEKLDFDGARENNYEKPKPKKIPTYHEL